MSRVYYICDACPGVSDVKPPCIISEYDFSSFALDEKGERDYCIGNGHGGAVWNKYTLSKGKIMNIEHLHEGVKRTSKVLQWVAVPVPVKQSSITTPSGTSGTVGLGFALAAVVALRDAARGGCVPSVVMIDDSVVIVDEKDI